MTARMARRVTFSAGHRYWRSDLSAVDNEIRFGRWASPFNHGHNYVLWVEVVGDVDEYSGMIVNIKDVDAVLQEHVVAALDQRSLNDEIPAFRQRPPTLENLLRYLWVTLEPRLPSACRLTGLRLEETPLLYAELTQETDRMNATLTRIYEFAAAHRLYNPDLPEEENQRLYGKCANPNAHGHNYVLEVTVSGEIDPETGMMVDILALDRTVHAEVVDRYDHHNLNVDLPEFEGRVTTSENVAMTIFARLRDTVPGRLERVRLFETARNVFEVTA